MNENRSDVIVIGGGVIGLCSAYYLHQAGYSVTLLEKGELGDGSSGGNAGLIVPSHFIPLAAPGVIGQGLRWMFNPESPFYIKPRLNRDLLNWLWKFRAACTQSHVEQAMPLLLEMHLASLSLYKALAALPELNFGFEQRGLLMLYKTTSSRQECVELVKTARQFNLEAEMLDTAGVQAKMPGIKAQVGGGACFSRDAHLNPARLVTALGQLLRQNGVTIHTNTEVLNIERAAGTVTGVATLKGRFVADEVVLAGGAWSPNLVRALPLKLPIQAAKGYSFVAPQLAGKLKIPLLLADAKVAVTPLEEGVRFAGTLEMAGLDLSINRRRVRAMRRAIPHYLGKAALNGTGDTEVWAGLRPCTPDGLPIIGRAPQLQNLIIATGHAMLGISLAPVSGQLVANIISGESPSINVAALSAARFNQL